MVKEVMENIKVCTDKVLPLISAICDKIQLSEIIDSNVGEERSGTIVSTGKAVKAMVMNIVSGRKPAYRLKEFYKATDTEKMFGEGISPEHMTDDTIARALDDVFESGAKKIMTETAMSIINKYKIPVKSIHADTTSKSLYGEYDDEDEIHKDAIDITFGHSKDFRKDLKQILFGLGTTKERIVVVGNVCDGNTNDKTWNKDILKDLRESMKKHGLKDFVYVADSAAVTEGMLKELAGDENNVAIDFVSRFPANYKLEQTLKNKANEEDATWQYIGNLTDREGAAEYKTKSYMDKLYGRTYRFIVCHSTQLSTQKENTLKRNLKKENEVLLKKIKSFEKIKYYCEKDALEAVKRFEAENTSNFHIMTSKVCLSEKISKRKTMGRPKNGDAQEKTIIYTANIKLFQDDLRIKEYKDKESLFVLITSITDDVKMTCGEVLAEYKGQSSVETSFRVLKDPCFIDELFYKKPHRVEALAYIMLISLMVLVLLERTVRENLKSEKERIIVSGQRRTFTPTGLSIIQTFENVQVIIVNENGRMKRFCQIDDNLKRLIRLAGFEPEIYINAYQKAS